MLERVIQKLSIDIVFKFISFVIAVFLGGYSIKVLGLEQLGFIQLLQVIFSFVLCIGGCNIFTNGLVNLFAGQNKFMTQKEYSSIINTCALIILIYSIIFTFAACLTLRTYSNISQENYYCIFIIALIQFFISASTLFQSVLLGKGRLVYVGWSDGVLSLLTSLGLLCILFIYGNVLTYLMLMGAFALIRFLFYSVSCISYSYYNISFMISFKGLLKVPLFCKSAYAASLVQALNCSFDTILVSIFGGISAVPVYSMAQNILFGIHSVMYNTAGSVFAVLSRPEYQHIEKIKIICGDFFWGISRLGLAAYSTACLLVPLLMAYQVGYEFAKDLCFFMFFSSVMGVGMLFAAYAGAPLMALKKMRLIAILDWITTLGVFVLSILLAYFIQAKGIILGRTFYIISGILYIYFLNRSLLMDWKKIYELLPVFIAVFLLGILVFCLSQFIENIIFCFTIIAGFLALSGLFAYYDWRAGKFKILTDIYKRYKTR